VWPDGKRLAYQALGFDNLQRIGVVDVASGSKVEIPGLPIVGPNAPFDISHDARYLAITDGTTLASAAGGISGVRCGHLEEKCPRGVLGYVRYTETQ
jgi:hypothetical protein